MVIAETERLVVRHFHILDGDAMDCIFGDPEVMFYGRGVKTKEGVRDWLRGCLEDYHRKWGFGLWAVVEKRTGKVVGYCGLTLFPDIDGLPEIEIGYRLARAHWGQGFGTEAARAVRDYSFGTLNLRRLIALIHPQNAASIRVAEKTGLRYEKEVLLEGYSHPDHVYAIARPMRGN